MRDEINWTALRIKILIFGFIIIFFLVGSCKAVFATTWSQVQSQMDYFQQQNPSCVVWANETLLVNGAGTYKQYSIYKRCNSGTGDSQDVILYYSSNGNYTGYKCDGTSATATHVAYGCVGGACQKRTDTMKCDGTMTSSTPVNYTPSMAGAKQECPFSTNKVNDCENYDTLLYTMTVDEDNCTPGQLQPGMPFCSNGYCQYYYIAGNCNCTPDGMKLESSSVVDGNANCFFRQVVGPPYVNVTNAGTYADEGYVVGEGNGADHPNTGASGGHDNTLGTGGTGGGTTSNTTINNTYSNSTGTNVTGTGGTSNTVSTNGTGTGTSTSISTQSTSSSGGVQSQQTSTTQYNTTYPQVGTTTPYSNGSLPTVGDFGTLFTDFTNHVKESPLFSQFSLNQMSPSGEGNSVFSMDMGRFGMQSVDLSTGASGQALSIIRGFVLLVAGFIAIRVVILKR
jgi:hypothetical protein